MSVFKKIKSIFNDGMEPLERGLMNYELNLPKVEELARQRAKDCSTCVNFVEEPVDFLRVTDERIPELSNMMCDSCGCSSKYLLRQDLKICKYWKK